MISNKSFLFFSNEYTLSKIKLFFSKDKGTCVVIGVTYGKKRNKIKAGNLLAFF